MSNSELREYGMFLENGHLMLVETYYNEMIQKKKNAIIAGNELLANEQWVKIHNYKLIKSYLTAYKLLANEQYIEAWYEFDKIDNLMNVVKDNAADIELILFDFLYDIVPKYQKLFPYKIFMSRESIINRVECSICGEERKLRSKCNHEPGKLYMGRLCQKIVTDMEILGLAIVTNPVDKYTVPTNIDYDYSVLKEFVEKSISPFQEFEIFRK